MGSSTPRTLESLKELQTERRRLLRRLMRDDQLAVGTVSVVLRKCGNPGCHCAQDNGHPQMLFLFNDDEG